jgi:hypothetical protein
MVAEPLQERRTSALVLFQSPAVEITRAAEGEGLFLNLAAQDVQVS